MFWVWGGWGGRVLGSGFDVLVLKFWSWDKGLGFGFWKEEFWVLALMFWFWDKG